MYDYFNLTDVIVIEPMYLDKNIYSHITREVKNIFIGKCRSVCGYIVDISEVDIKSTEISMADSTNRFTVTYKAKTILPNTGKKYKTITFINAFDYGTFKGGLFNLYEIEQRRDCVKTCIQIFITNGLKENDVFVFPTCGCSVDCSRKGGPCELDVTVDCAVYKDGKFCITGKHLH